MTLRPALFLDRDGVVNVEKHYVFRVEDFEFMGGLFEMCIRFRDAGFLVVVVTNQAGIARGYYTEADLERLNLWVTGRFAENGIELAGIYHCPHHPDFSGDCECRKPRPGMLLQAAREHGINLTESVLLGDKESDLEAGRRAGIRRLGLVTGHDRLETVRFGDFLLEAKDLSPALLSALAD